MHRVLVLAFSLACTSLQVEAQTTDSGLVEVASPSMAAVANAMHATIRRNLAEAAQKMPAEEYPFKPTPKVRTLGELVGHIATAKFFFCGLAKRERPPSTVNYEKATVKAVLVKA